MLTAFYLLVICCGIMWSPPGSCPSRSRPRRGRWSGRTGASRLRGEAHGHGLGNYRVLAGCVLVAFVVLYLIFR